ncbi:unnamed protein product, partial [Prorocentrum cordatum]
LRGRPQQGREAAGAEPAGAARAGARGSGAPAARRARGGATFLEPLDVDAGPRRPGPGRRRLYALHGHHCPFQCREALWLHQVRGDKRDLQQGCLRLGPRDRRPVPDRGRRELPRRAEPARPSPGAGGRPRGPARGVLLRGGGAAARRGAQRGRKGAA